MRKILLILLCALPLIAQPAGAEEGLHLRSVDVDMTDNAALQRGAKYFVNYCLSCHSLSAVRYNLFERLGLTPEQIRGNLIFTDRKIGETMAVAMRPEDAKRWFGAPPPDLSVIARARGADWLYTYLTTFYLDDTRPTGVNNLAFPKVGMPDVIWQLQGLQAAIPLSGGPHQNSSDVSIDHLNLVQPGTMTPVEYEHAAQDLVAFLVYVGEPSKLERQRLGLWVLAFLALLFVVSYFLKKEYWKDVRH
ncbi:cytochrome C [Acidihalobacter yilgarnensis]|uniref:Cytochrome C n=1 Tax=Acidihalobacter yilgarnensis TaxID=2819280 RepID=A0A1D8IRI9_9GAMM|nr:cytochrome c1 [Acidihalobacter yilgarnensis]AOU99017.1 cytochrome C [Acidihalobacter yilgarnensis]